MAAANSTTAPAIHVRVVGFWRRALAGAIDGVLFLPLLVLFAVATAAAAGRPVRSLGELGPGYAVELLLDGGVVGVAALVMAAVVAFLYFFVFIAARGQTPGQKMLRVRTIDAFGQVPTVWRALLRTGASFLSLAGAGLGYFWIAVDREKRALHDWLAGTYVVVVAGPEKK